MIVGLLSRGTADRWPGQDQAAFHARTGRSVLADILFYSSDYQPDQFLVGTLRNVLKVLGISPAATTVFQHAVTYAAAVMVRLASFVCCTPCDDNAAHFRKYRVWRAAWHRWR